MLVASAGMYAVPGLAAEPVLEKRMLFGADSAARWSVAESTLRGSVEGTRDGKPLLLWHIDVDHFGGEAKYPVGWPRISHTVREPVPQDWSEWDFLQLTMKGETSRDVLPREPLGLALHTPDKESAYHRSLAEVKKGAWTTIRIPLSEVKGRQKVTLMQFNIADANYRHGDKLDFLFEEIALLRYAQPVVLSFAPETSVMFADARQVSAGFELAGVKESETVEVTCELRQGGRVLGRESAALGRGSQQITVRLPKEPKPGDCELVARIRDEKTTATAALRVVPSPWKGRRL